MISLLMGDWFVGGWRIGEEVLFKNEFRIVTSQPTNKQKQTNNNNNKTTTTNNNTHTKQNKNKKGGGGQGEEKKEEKTCYLTPHLASASRPVTLQVVVSYLSFARPRIRNGKANCNV